MRQLAREVEVRFDEFSATWRDEMATAMAELADARPAFLASYRRLASLQAWRTTLLERRMPRDSLGFFFEAQNDGLVSHVAAAQGAWRSALQSLRSCIENVLACLYYKDHPVELQLWAAGRHRLGFSALAEYLAGHPVMLGSELGATGLELIRAEYQTLSRAVHASASSFRMTDATESTSLWLPDRARLGAWATRQKKTLIGLNLLLVVIYSADLQGTKLPGLRKSLSFVVPLSYHKRADDIGVSLFRT